MRSKVESVFIAIAFGGVLFVLLAMVFSGMFHVAQDNAIQLALVSSISFGVCAYHIME